MRGRSLTIALAVLAIVAFAWPASAQVQRGALYGTVTDQTGAVLPGTTLTLSSPSMAPLTITSGSRGEFRFDQLDPGTYTLTANLQNFAPYTRKNIIITVGADIRVPVQMALASEQAQVTVTAPTEVMSEKTYGYATTFGDAELNKVPTARDPWVLMQQVPGVIVDRVNVGGSESGQQSQFQARGADVTNTMWNIDGVTLTDMGAIGSSPAYYNFDVFQDVQFTTGATDPRQQTGALGINMVTKRGTNMFHGSGRYFFDNHSLQTTNLPSNLVACPPGSTRIQPGCYAGNQINQIADYGGDVGGPIVKDKLWFWGSAAKNDIRQFVITGAPDNTTLVTYSAKGDFQATPQNHLDFFFYRNDKQKVGRNAGPTRPPETTWNQGGPTDIYKIEDSHTFGSHLMVTGSYSHVHAGFFLNPQGGLTPNVYLDLDSGGVWHGSYLEESTDRPQDQASANANYFRGMHELKVGFQYRRTPISTVAQWGGPAGGYSIVGDSLGLPPGTSLVTLTRAQAASEIQQDTGFWGGDTISLDRFTVDLALRYDHQSGNNTASTAPANPLAPNILPAYNLPTQSTLFTWNSWSPRAGVTYRLDDKTNVRASYAFYQGQLPAAYMQATNPLQLSGITYMYADDGSHVPTAANINFNRVISSYGVDASNPLGPSPNTVDPNLVAPRTHSVLVALDREVMPNFAVSTSFGYGHTSDLIWQTYPGLTSADFVQIGTIGQVVNATTGQVFNSNTPYYGLAPGVVLPPGSLLTNRQGYHQRYWSWDVSATKRLSQNWMVRGNFTLSNTQEFFDDPSVAIQDPTPLAVAGAGTTGAGYSSQPEFTNTTWVMPNLNGGVVTSWPGAASGSTTDVFLNAKWSYSVMGMYQFKYGINASGTVYGRQGYPNPDYFLVNRDLLGTGSPILVNPDLNAVRNPSVNIVDLRAEKSIKYRGIDTVIGVDAFNVFNSNTLLQANRLITSSTYGQPRQIVAPRIFRFGLRIGF